MDSKYGLNWSEDETILAFSLYCRMPFGKIHARNPQIIELANLLGRTPAAVSRKLGNLGHFDPELAKRNVHGLSNTSKLDEEIFHRFSDDWEGLAFRSAQIEAQLRKDPIIVSAEEYTMPEGKEKERIVRARVNQQFFRSTVLSAYRGRCCITGITVPGLLISSHIKPWAVSDAKTERTNPQNGLCLNALHDKAFDLGFITILPDYRVLVSEKIRNYELGEASNLLLCSGKRIELPEKFMPRKDFLEYHNDVVFLRL